MNFIPLTVSLDEACFGDFVKRYHFEEKDKKDILRLYRKVQPRVHAEFHYVIEKNDRTASGSDWNRESQMALVVMTLGRAFDEFQEGILQGEDIRGAYIVDCLGLEFMWAAYEEIDKKLFELTGLYAGNYIYAGDCELPITEMPKLMKKLGQKQVTCNEAYALIPKKSVVFEVPLTKVKKKKYARCEACSNENCSIRQTA
ncbi:MAG: hypothetical protein II842_10795 [Butyrivibrio sp.]|nr:hypothetical protein [Butyrivibrio sp.]